MPVNKTESIALETAKEAAAGLKIVLQKIEEISTIVIRLQSKSDSTEELLKTLAREVRGAEGQDSVPTRLRLIEQQQTQLIAEVNSIKGREEESRKDARARNWQLWFALITAIIAAVLSLVMSFLPRGHG